MDFLEAIINLAIPLSIVFLVAYSLKKVSEVAKEKVKRSNQVQTSNPGPGNILKAMPPSLQDLVNGWVSGSDLMAKDIATEYAKQGKNPMEDVGYQRVIARYNQGLKWQERLEKNPYIYSAAELGYQGIRYLAPGFLKSTKKIVDGLGHMFEGGAMLE